METQTAQFRNPLRSAIPFIRSSKTHSVASISTPFLSKICYPSWISFKVHRSFQSQALSKRNLQFINNVVRLESKGSIDVGEDNPVSEIKKKNLAVFVSGGGSNFRSIHEAGLSGSVHGDIAVLVTDKPECGGAEFAREKGIPVFIFPERKDAQEGLSAENLVIALRSYKVDFILLAGYLKLIPTELIRAFPKSILNIHPSLLPAFGGKGYYGMKVHKAVIASGARYSGPTIHFVDEQYDTGRILAQRVVPVLAYDTFEELAARVLHEEHRLYVEVVSALCEDRIVWREDGVPLIKSKENPS
ncbi:LOW QUALITY PROTEIN: phosphoribosylglycinamide formyltransferase, chloroplastic-like [Primulina eburnea]|uniref:LOW QUALITY PROTEIN: phosphoribosylglycinamide formyltransferase, chloroplastic-like n=1 Tax=Primulina eburnea TaxID=1245227 RepID=UPI003C6CA775